MATSQLTKRLLDNIKVLTPGAVDPGIKLELMSVLDDFFRASNIWTETIPVTVGPGSTQYELVPTGPVKIVRLLQTTDENNIPVRAGLIELGTLEIAVEPSATTTLQVVVSLSVDRTAPDSDTIPQVPDWIVEKYFDGIVQGTAGRMQAQPAKPYSDVKQAALRLRMFTSTKSAARIEARRMFTFGTQSFRFPRNGWV